MQIQFAIAAVIVLSPIVPAAAQADELPAWPVRLNIAMPFGASWGDESLDVFTWGFRAAAHAYPTSPRGPGLGLFAEMLLDADSDARATFGVSASVPVGSLDMGGDQVAVRAGAIGGRRIPTGSEGAERAVAGVQVSLEYPAYFYESRIGLRAEATLDGASWTATTVVVDVELLAVLGLLAHANR